MHSSADESEEGTYEVSIDELEDAKTEPQAGER